MKGYLSVNENSEKISKNQISELIYRLEDYLVVFDNEIEQDIKQQVDVLEENEEDDLPF